MIIMDSKVQSGKVGSLVLCCRYSRSWAAVPATTATALLGTERDFEVWTYNSNNSTQIKCSRQFLSKIGPILISWILAKCNGWFLELWFCSVRSTCIPEAMHWSHPSHRAEADFCEILESVLAVCAKLFWNFHQSLRGCSALAGYLQYITCLSIYYQDMTCFMVYRWKNSVLLYSFWDKISIFHLGKTEHRF